MNIFVNNPDGLHRLKIKQFGKTLVIRAETVPFARKLAIDIAGLFGKDTVFCDIPDAIGFTINEEDSGQEKAKRIGFTMEDV